jgi:ribonuclease P protein component
MKNQEISTLIGQKRAYNSSSFLLYVSKIRPNVPKSTRNIAILASKKNFKTAVSRNKVRRMIRNALNKAVFEFEDNNISEVSTEYTDKKAQIASYNLIFSLKKGFEKLVFADLVVEIKQSLLKNGII